MPRITKDEAVIISAVIDSGWDYFLRNELSRESRNEKAVFLKNLSERLDKEGTDLRRQGRTSNNDFNQIWKRALKKQKANG